MIKPFSKGGARFVQIFNPRSGHYIKCDRKTGMIVAHKRTEGAYKGIPIMCEGRPTIAALFVI